MPNVSNPTCRTVTCFCFKRSNSESEFSTISLTWRFRRTGRYDHQLSASRHPHDRSVEPPAVSQLWLSHVSSARTAARMPSSSALCSAGTSLRTQRAFLFSGEHLNMGRGLPDRYLREFGRSIGLFSINSATICADSSNVSHLSVRDWTCISRAPRMISRNS